MQNRFALIIGVLGILISSCSGQKSNEELILGTWVHEDKEREMFVYFQEDGKVDFQVGEYIHEKANYKIINDTTLILGNREYAIRELSDSILVLYSSLSGFDRYSKSNKTIEPISEFIDIEEYYDNGQLRVKGKIHNGFQDGKWIMYYKTGEVLSVQYFSEGVYLEKPNYFDKEGNEISQGEYDDYIDKHWPKAEE